MRGILYGIGVGPGDPELITLKAVKRMQEADIIAAPTRNGSDQSELGVAYKIALQAVPEIKEKETLGILFPMVRNEAILKKAHREAADLLEKYLYEGKTIAFLTLGDPCVYSTLSYVAQIVKEDGYEVDYINGVPSFCAAAAQLGIPLAEGKEAIHILPALQYLQDSFEPKGTCVIMKSGRKNGEWIERLEQKGLQVQMAENCTMSDQKLYRSREEIPEQSGYFTLLIGRQNALGE